MVTAIAGTDATRAAELAQAADVPVGSGDWRAVVEHAEVDAVAIAVPPRIQPDIALAALSLGKPVFLEKPLAADLAAAEKLRNAAGRLATMVDFSFREIPAWRKAKSLLDAGAIGRLRHLLVTWNVENYATRMRLRNWKTMAADGGGALGNFASHTLDYLEWFCGPLSGISARLSGIPDAPDFETNVALTLAFQSGAAGSFSMSCASYLGSGHRLEFYGEDGTLVLANATTDYMRGFTLHHARRPAKELQQVPIDPDPVDSKFPQDGRIAPVSRLAARWFDAIEQGGTATPGIAEGYRVQVLLDLARRAHASGCFTEVPA
jgi:predicted dehydrogenase